MPRGLTGPLFFLCVILAAPLFAQGPMEISNKLADYSFRHPQEKIYIHTDKPFYVPGETLWFKVYLMTGPYHIPDTISTVVYVELIDSLENVLDRKAIRAREGLGWGDFILPGSLHGGKILLRAYTRYMRNYDPAFYFRKNIRILSARPQEDKGYQNDGKRSKDQEADQAPFSLQFFPEGGDLVNGLQNYVAFKATGPEGKGIDINGFIGDEEGDTVALLETRRFGLGQFTLRPDVGGKYKAVVLFEGQEYTFPLPEALEKGYVMHIKKTGDKVLIWVRNNMGIKMNNSFVLGQFRGFPFITFPAKEGQDFLYSSFSAKELPSGIIHFTFFDSLGIPRCERLVYHHNANEKLDFTFESAKETYRRREKTEFYIHCTDLSGNPILTNVSLSVTNTALVNPDPDRSNLKTWFNLESDLRGEVENPGYYFNPDHADRFELLDLLMMTHGWRRFTWEKILDEEPPGPMIHPAEIGFTIEGQLRDFYNPGKPLPGEVRLFIFENQLYYNELETDDRGRFKFAGVNVYDSTEVVMNAWREIERKNRKGKKKDPKINNDYVIRVKPQTVAEISRKNWPDLDVRPITIEEYLALNRNILTIDSSYDERTIVLDELTVEEQRIEDDPFSRAYKLYERPNNRIVLDSLSVGEQSGLLFDLIRRYVPGVNITGSPPDVNVVIRGANSISGTNEATILLDGIQVESDFVYYFPVSEIAFIDVLKRASPGVVQDRSGTGVIALYTREEPIMEEEGRKGIANFVFPGYYRAREFFTPDYEVPEEKHIKPDYRRTLYWNPSLTTDDQGDMSFSFYTSDEQAEYRIRIEGMSYNGIPVVKDYYFGVK